MMLFFSPGEIVQDGTHYFRDHASASNPGWNLFTLNAMFLQAKPYYLSNLWKLFCQPYYFIVSAHREEMMYSLRIQYGGLGRVISQRKVF